MMPQVDALVLQCSAHTAFYDIVVADTGPEGGGGIRDARRV